MRKIFIYGLLLVLASLTHSAASKTKAELCKSPSPAFRQENCSISQHRPSHTILQDLYAFYSTQTCDMSHADVTHVPTDKGMLLLLAYFCGHKTLQTHPAYAPLHCAPQHSYNPITYYIYGLRKIVV